MDWSNYRWLIDRIFIIIYSVNFNLVLFVIGGKEVEAGTVSVREHLKGNIGAKLFSEMLEYFKEIDK